MIFQLYIINCGCFITRYACNDNYSINELFYWCCRTLADHTPVTTIPGADQVTETHTERDTIIVNKNVSNIYILYTEHFALNHMLNAHVLRGIKFEIMIEFNKHNRIDIKNVNVRGCMLEVFT